MAYDYRTLCVERSGSILTLIFNRPQALNAVDEAMHGELSHVFREIAADAAAEVVILTGAGRGFSAGGDTALLQHMIDDEACWRKTHREAKQITLSLLELHQPVIAKVNGPAAGLGATLALCSDIIFASDKAGFGDAHVKVGLVAGDGGPFIWPLLVGYARAREHLFTGEQISAAQAAGMGLINHCVPHEELDARVEAFARRLAGGALRAIAGTKQAVNAPLRAWAIKNLEISMGTQGLSNHTAEHQEAVRAFDEKRRPDFARSAGR